MNDATPYLVWLDGSNPEALKRFLESASAAGGVMAIDRLDSLADVPRIAAALASGNPAEVAALLHDCGFDLLDVGRVDVVLAAVDALDAKTRREDAAVLALRGVAHATKGRPARAEALLRRALAQASGNHRFAATVTLRLALLLANRGEDVRELLEPIAADAAQSADIRAEALSLVAAQRALSGDAAAATGAIEAVKTLLPSVDHDIARAKILQRVGVAAVNTGDIDGAQRALEEAADLAMELGLFSLASRAYVSLAILTRQHGGDVSEQLRFTEGALGAAERSGDLFDIETALLHKLDIGVRCGDERLSVTTEERLAKLSGSRLQNNQYVTLARALRQAWQGNFGQSHRILARCRNQLHYQMERLQYGALFALLLELDNKREESLAAASEIWSELRELNGDGIFERRQRAIALLYGAITRSLQGRFAHADSALGRLDVSDEVIAAISRIGQQFLDQARQRQNSGSGIVEADLDILGSTGYAEVAILARSVGLVLAERFREEPESLSPAERNVLQLLNEGLATKHVAARMGRSVFTIRAHIANAIGKLECHGRAEALAKARLLGIVS